MICPSFSCFFIIIRIMIKIKVEKCSQYAIMLKNAGYKIISTI